MRATSGSTSSRMSASVTMLPVRFDMRTSWPSFTTLTNWPRMISGSAAVEAERLHPRLQRLHLAVVIGAPDVDEVREAAPELVAVIREVVAEIGRAAVAAHEHAVALIAEVGRAQPPRALVLVDEPLRPRAASSTSATSPRSCSVRSENHVSKCTPTRARSSCRLCTTRAVAPLARVVGGDVVAELGVQLRGHVDEVLALVPVLGRLLAPVARRRASRGTCRAARPRRSGSTRGAPRRLARRAGSRSRRRPRPSARRRRAAGPVGFAETNSRLIRRPASTVERPYSSPAATTSRNDIVQPRGREKQVEETRARRSRPSRGAGPCSASSADLDPLPRSPAAARRRRLASCSATFDAQSP